MEVPEDQRPGQNSEPEQVIDLNAAAEAAKSIIGTESSGSSVESDLSLGSVGFELARINASRAGAPTNEARILNKKDWHARVDDMDKLSRAQQQPLSILFSDVHRFKDINDTLGHSIGDGIIVQLKKIAAKSLRGDSGERQGDAVSVGEMGGDEIAAAVIGDEDVANMVEARWISAFNEWLDLPENAAIKKLGVGLSIGKATRAADSEMTASELLRAADEAMYNEKLSHSPELKRRQRLAMFAARLVLERFGKVRLRDLPKYEHVQRVRRIP